MGDEPSWVLRDIDQGRSGVKQVFVAQHPLEAHFVKGLLEAEGIPAEVLGEVLWGARGEIPVSAETLPSVWVLNDEAVQPARRVVEAFVQGEVSLQAQGPAWICPGCGEELEPQFTACWQCEAIGQIEL
jgi:hypothetical protein